MNKKILIVGSLLLLLIVGSAIAVFDSKDPVIIATRTEIAQLQAKCLNNQIHGGMSFKGLYLLNSCDLTTDYNKAFADAHK
jgi:hypothetical protein